MGRARPGIVAHPLWSSLISGRNKIAPEGWTSSSTGRTEHSQSGMPVGTAAGKGGSLRTYVEALRAFSGTPRGAAGVSPESPPPSLRHGSSEKRDFLPALPGKMRIAYWPVSARVVRKTSAIAPSSCCWPGPLAHHVRRESPSTRCSRLARSLGRWGGRGFGRPGV